MPRSRSRSEKCTLSEDGILEGASKDSDSEREKDGRSMDRTYDEKALLSLFGYGRTVHERPGGICQLCGCGSGQSVDFDLWRQFTIEHLIGRSQGGYPDRIRTAVDERFSHLDEAEREALASRIHEANVVTACQFCNSTTSRDIAPFTMEEAIATVPTDPDEAVQALANKLRPVLEAKQSRVHWKLQSVYRGFRETIEPELDRRRSQEPAMREPRDLSHLEVSPNPPHGG